MADTIAPEIKPPTPTVSEALAVGGEAATGFSPALKSAQEFGRELRKFKDDEKPDGKTIIKEARKRYKKKELFSEEKADEMKAHFKENQEEASNQIDQITSVITYGEILEQAKLSGREPQIIAQEKGLTRLEYRSIKTDALDALLNNPVTGDLFPELKELGAPNAQRAYIEATLASDPQLANSLIAEMRELQARAAKDLPEIKENPELAEARKAQREAQARFDEIEKPEQETSGAVIIGENSAYTEAQVKLKQATEAVQRKEQELGDTSNEDKQKRLVKESELIEDLEKVLGNSILKTIDERYKSVAELTQQQHEKQLAEAQTEADKVVIKAIENNWVSYNRLSRSKDVHRDRIGRDMRVAAYMGEDGIKRMILRDLRAGGIELKDKDGNVIDAASYLDEGVLDKLSDSHREVVDKMYTEKGEEYRTKLFTDFFAARNLKDRLGYGIGLKDHEWELMEKHFGEKIDAGLQNSKEAQTVMTNLAERGVAKPNFKFKWLLYVLIGLGLLAKGAASSI